MSDDIPAKAEALSGLVKALDDLPGGKVEYRQVYREMAEIFPELVAEVKRLREQVANQYESIETLCRDLDPQLVRLMKEKQELRKQLAAKDAELAKWKQIAIEERCKAIMLIEKLKDVANNPDWQTRGLSLTHDEYMQQAAEELGIQEDDDEDLTIAYMLGGKRADERLTVLQEYVARLESDYLSWVQAYYCDLGEEVAIQRARDALEKIRHAN